MGDDLVVLFRALVSFSSLLCMRMRFIVLQPSSYSEYLPLPFTPVGFPK
jgi:hypothetical protein